jgi:hypothetical protein
MNPTTISFVRHGAVYNPQDVYYDIDFDLAGLSFIA